MLDYQVRCRRFQTPINNMHGACDLVIDGRIVIPGFKVLESKKGDLFIGAPSVKSNKTDDQGKTVYYPTVSFIDAKINDDDFKTPLEEEIFNTMLEEFRKASPAQRQDAASAGGTPPGTPKPNKRHPLWNKD